MLDSWSLRWNMINRKTKVMMVSSYECIHTSDWFCILPDIIGPSFSKAGLIPERIRNKIPEPSNRCFQMFRFILWRFQKSISIYTLYFVDDRDLKSSIESSGWSFSYCFWNSPILYIDIWQLLQKKQYKWFINHSFSWLAPRGKGQWLERCSRSWTI